MLSSILHIDQYECVCIGLGLSSEICKNDLMQQDVCMHTSNDKDL